MVGDAVVGSVVVGDAVVGDAVVGDAVVGDGLGSLVVGRSVGNPVGSAVVNGTQHVPAIASSDEHGTSHISYPS